MHSETEVTLRSQMLPSGQRLPKKSSKLQLSPNVLEGVQTETLERNGLLLKQAYPFTQGEGWGNWVGLHVWLGAIPTQTLSLKNFWLVKKELLKEIPI